MGEQVKEETAEGWLRAGKWGVAWNGIFIGRTAGYGTVLELAFLAQAADTAYYSQRFNEGLK